MNLPPPKICERIYQLFVLLGSTSANEAANAREKLIKLLSKLNLGWNDLPIILDAIAAKNAAAPPPPPSQPTEPPRFNVLDLILRLIELHLAFIPEQRMATALWALHSYVFGRYRITPRMAFLSPVSGCGKTTALVLLEMLTADPYRSDNVTAASVYHTLAERKRTMLLDEGDNLGLLKNPVLRAVFNSGHRRGGVISRFIGGRPRTFSLFAPLAIAAIGTLPQPMLNRSIVINMRPPASGDAPLEELDELDPAFAATRVEIQKWAATCALAPKPEMPAELHNRHADNWRPLLAIADALGHGEAARAAAIALNGRFFTDDPLITLLRDIRTVFDDLGVDRLASIALIEALLALDSLWHDWCGPNDDRPAHTLTQHELARLLRRFGIRPRPFWPAHRLPGSKSSRGYRRSQFEAIWAAYCPATVTPSHPSKINLLPRP